MKRPKRRKTAAKRRVARKATQGSQPYLRRPTLALDRKLMSECDKILRERNSELTEYLNAQMRVLLNGQEITLDGSITFGKYRGVPTKTVIAIDLPYMLWAINNVTTVRFSAETRAAVMDADSGDFEQLRFDHDQRERRGHDLWFD